MIWFSNHSPLDPEYRWVASFSRYDTNRLLPKLNCPLCTCQKDVFGFGSEIFNQQKENWVQTPCESSRCILIGSLPRRLWRVYSLVNSGRGIARQMHVRTVTFAKPVDLYAFQMVPTFGFQNDSNILTSLRWISRSLQRCRNSLRVLKLWHKWLYYWFSVVTALVFDFHCVFLHLLITAVQSLVVTSYFPRHILWTYFWRSLQYYAPYIRYGIGFISYCRRPKWRSGRSEQMGFWISSSFRPWYLRQNGYIFTRPLGTSSQGVASSCGYVFIVATSVKSSSALVHRSGRFQFHILFDCWNPTLVLGVLYGDCIPTVW